MTLRVRYVETDAMGVAHHSSYVPWLELARIEALRDLGHSYADLEASGVRMPVISLEMSYRRSLRFDDEALLRTTMTLSGPSRIAFDTEVLSADKLCASGSVTVATVNAEGRPMRVPEELASLLAEV